MFRSPVFKHESQPTDFLVIRLSNRSTNVKYYLRNISHLFVVGQTMPASEVPTPHSRKATMVGKARLRMISYRLLKQQPDDALNSRLLLKHFVEQTEMQIRNRLKDFMEYQRSGDAQGLWKMKPTESLPPEEAIRTMVSPENACLLEAMQVGIQHLEDSGYSRTGEEEEEQDESKLSIEQQLAPWSVTRSFISATQGKAMLKINGEGDPTGRGEGFSFVKTSMKGGFKPSGESVEDRLKGEAIRFTGHNYSIAQQARLYEDEIMKVWNNQKLGLSVKQESVADEGEEWSTGIASNVAAPAHRPSLFSGQPRSNQSPAPSVADTLADRDDDGVSYASQLSASSANKMLRITRLVKDDQGRLQRQLETIKDPHIINAYVKRRQNIEAQAVLNLANYGPTDDEARNEREKKALQEELSRLRRNHERRLVRQAQKYRQDMIAAGTPLGSEILSSLAAHEGQQSDDFGFDESPLSASTIGRSPALVSLKRLIIGANLSLAKVHSMPCNWAYSYQQKVPSQSSQSCKSCKCFKCCNQSPSFSPSRSPSAIILFANAIVPRRVKIAL